MITTVYRVVSVPLHCAPLRICRSASQETTLRAIGIIASEVQVIRKDGAP